MKRLLALAAVCALALSFVGGARAGFIATHGKARGLQVNTYALYSTIADSRAHLTSGTGTAAFIDSEYTTPSLTPPADTTGDLVNIEAPAHSSVADSLAFLTVAWTGTGAGTSGDSVYATIDGSFDGATWTNLLGNSTFGGYVTGASIAMSAVNGGAIRFNGANAGTTNVAGTALATGPAGGTVYATRWFIYPVLRVRVRSKITNTAGAIQFRLRVWTPSTSSE